MKNKLSQWLINYMKNKKCKTFNQDGINLTNVSSDKSWTELNPLRDIEQLPSNVVKFLNEKHNKEKGDK
jgi:hypothetical protein